MKADTYNWTVNGMVPSRTAGRFVFWQVHSDLERDYASLQARVEELENSLDRLIYACAGVYGVSAPAAEARALLTPKEAADGK